MRKNLALLILVIIVFITIFIVGFRSINRPSTEYDEGWYLNTFVTVSQGNPLYRTTFFSQPPGFFLLTYPGFNLMGKTLPSVRLTVFFWSLIGLIGIFWLAYELGNVWIAFITIGILFLTNRYYNEIITFHADALPLTFSCLSIASMIRFFNTSKARWFLLSIIMFITAFWIKFDFTAILPLTYIFFSKITKTHFSLKKIIWSLVSSVLLVIVLSYLYLSSFSFTHVYLDVVAYRLQAQQYYPFSLGQILFSLKNNMDLFLIIIAVTLLAFIKLKKQIKIFSFKIFFLWSISSFSFMFLYRPLLPHHLFILTIPFSFFLSYLLYDYFLSQNHKKNISKKIAIFILFVLLFQSALLILSYKQKSLDIQKSAIQLIYKNTKKTDYIISDDGLLPAITDRLTPPELVDLSQVRINSKNLTLNMFEKDLIRYKPKLVFFWADRLEYLQGIKELLKKHKYVLLSEFDPKHKVYMLIN